MRFGNISQNVIDIEKLLTNQKNAKTFHVLNIFNHVFDPTNLSQIATEGITFYIIR